MSIANYDSEENISKCLEAGCILYTTLIKTVETMALSWKYQGDLTIFASITLKSIKVIEDDGEAANYKPITIQ